MQNMRQFASAFSLAVFSVLLVIGSLSLSLAEAYIPVSPEATATVPTTPVPITVTVTAPIPVDSPTATSTPTPTNTPQPAPSCPQPPLGWISVAVQAGDTLNLVAARYNATTEQLRAANCLLTDSLVQGSSLFVPPPLPTSVITTGTLVRCGQPPGWVKAYVVHAGETLFGISQNYGISLSLLKSANCKDDRNLINVGEVLWVPNVPTRTPTSAVTFTPNFSTPNPTEPLTETALPFTQTILPFTATNIPPTDTPIPTSTSAPTLTASPTAFPTASP
jgi:LysM repeat protein